MKTLIVGGNINPQKESKIINTLVSYHKRDKLSVANGVLPKTTSGQDLIIWMPNIDNEEPKDRSIKDMGSVMIISKVIGINGRTKADAVKRIFDFGANAVIAIDKSQKVMLFHLIDALGNTWKESENIKDIYDSIFDLYDWTKGSIRINVQKDESLKKLIEINKELSICVTKNMGKRYFGNISTRCMKLFPSTRRGEQLLVSPRNIDKEHITENDMVLVNSKDGAISYFGDRKPSVDTPIQLEIYKNYPNINFMIHGHYLFSDLKTTEHYFPCGDLREYDEIKSFLDKGINYFNLKNHGFLLCAETVEEMFALVCLLILGEKKWIM